MSWRLLLASLGCLGARAGPHDLLVVSAGDEHSRGATNAVDPRHEYLFPVDDNGHGIPAAPTGVGSGFVELGESSGCEESLFAGM